MAADFCFVEGERTLAGMSGDVVRYTKIVLLLLIMFYCRAWALPASGDEEAEEKQAVRAASAWLGLIDSGDYAQSWQEASTTVQKAVSRDHWVQSIHKVRSNYGDLVARTKPVVARVKELPGMRDGDYYVLQFKTTFRHKKAGTEIVSLEKRGDAWKPLGYFIR